MKYILTLEAFNRENISIVKVLNPQQFKEAVHLCVSATANETYPYQMIHYALTQDPNKKCNPKLSTAAFDKNTNEMIGAILGTENSIQKTCSLYMKYYPGCKLVTDIDEYKNLRGLEAVILGVKEEYRKSMVAYKMICEFIKTDYDYIIIEQSPMYRNNINYLNKAKKVLDLGGAGSIYIYDVKK